LTEALSPAVGQRLASARQAKGLSLDYVAEKLKLSVHQVEAIEADDFSHLPAPVFVRGFVRNYARLLEIDPNSLLTALEMEQRPTEQLTAPSEGVRLEGSRVRKWLLVPLLLLLLFLALVAGLYAWLSQGEDALVTSGELAQPVAPMVETTPVPLPAETEPAIPALTETPATPVEPPVPEQPAGPPSAPVQPLPVAPLPAAPQAAAPVDATPPQAQPMKPASSGSALRFRVDEDAWIQVVDGAGQRFSRLVRAGTTETLRGTPPFKLVVGNAAQVKLDYNDHAIDLKPFTGEKVARLTLE
jgi:cytoskeleton protein RodZ